MTSPGVEINPAGQVETLNRALTDCSCEHLADAGECCQGEAQRCCMRKYDGAWGRGQPNFRLVPVPV